MQTAQGNTLDSLRNVKAFMEQHTDKLGDVIRTGIQAELLQTISELEEFSEQQTAGAATAKNALKVKRALRHALIHDYMTVVSRIGRAKLPDVPQFENLKMPRGTLSSARLTEAAYEMANSALENEGIFVAAGLPADFVARMKAAADAVTEARLQRSIAKAKRTVATQALSTKLSSSRRLVYVLDAMVKSAIGNDPILLSGWKQVMHVPKVPGGGRASDSPDSPAPSTPAAPALAA